MFFLFLEFCFFVFVFWNYGEKKLFHKMSEKLVLEKIREITMMEEDEEVDLSSQFRELGLTSLMVSQLCSEVEAQQMLVLDRASIGVRMSVSDFVKLVDSNIKK